MRGLVKDPNTMLSFVYPILDQALGSDIAILAA
jgi:hypothetical protein